MLLDNENKKVYEWISEYTENGTMDVVTGYFTVGAVAYLSNKVNENIKSFRFILGDIVNIDMIHDRTLDLLNENITVEAAINLTKTAREAVEFLKQDKVLAKTLEPNFCHAKVYLFDHSSDSRHHYYISGSSNLTEAGIGLKITNNVELNIADTGNDNQYIELKKWFDELWNKKQAHEDKTIIDEAGNKTVLPFKQYLIEAIEKIFIKYTPKQLYYKVLFELFGNLLAEQEDPEFNRQVGRLENTVIYKSLFEFQQKGVLSLIRMIQKYDGAILADAVGLGKTWSALAVMKYYQLQGRQIILLCPKKLKHNWFRYKKDQESKFEKDQLEFFVRYHTDMMHERMEKYSEPADKLFTSDKPKLIVIDESHNFRNGKSQRYNFLVNEILKKNEDIKVLMLSATPINNTLIDIRNQFKLIKQGKTEGFQESHDIKNIDYTFIYAQRAFNEWKMEENPRISEFIKKLPDNFFKLTDTLTVARTRQMIEKQTTSLYFPKKQKPENIFVTPKQIGNFDSFEELFKHFPPLLSGYQPAFYIEQAANVDKLHDERQRDRFLVKMIYILLVKRLESSWFSFHSTVKKVHDHHQNAFDKINEYQSNKETMLKSITSEEIFTEDEFDDFENDLSIGRREVKLKEIDKAGYLNHFKNDLKQDIEALDLLRKNLDRFSEQISAEIKKPNNYKSKDEKLESLISKIIEKRKSPDNDNNQKVVIFTVYKDTAFYLFDQLKARGFNKLAVVSGDVSKTDSEDTETKLIEPILERFAPFTKLYNEKEWKFCPSDTKLSKKDQYSEWIGWVKENEPKTYEKLQHPIDILIATDVLSEGQNLQDCDMVINYDIHWNPVRVIQRMGRIDRIGSINETISGINYWPSNNINSYLNLKGRIEERMAMMKLAGSEVQLEFSDSFKAMAEDAAFEDKMNERMLRQMQVSWDDIEANESGLGFDNLSLEDYRQDLLQEMSEKNDYYRNMPKGVYTGFLKDSSVCGKEGMIALLGYPAKPPKVLDHEYRSYDLIYIDNEGKKVLINEKEVLVALAHHKENPREVPDGVDKGESAEISKYVNAVKLWLDSRAEEDEILEDGTIVKRAGAETKDILSKLKTGDTSAVKRFKENIKVSDKYKLQNFDLIAWFVIQ